ncbi:MAG: hypothetical protein WBQ38_15415 [Ignavibacteria bacterium]|nr:hypothetical protein [Ignavibacteria bacterium]MBK7160404.1 hypothetical protein [Ignavibacteria bacterium]MBK7447672.1 hypothetical protein [Ignavibacteria bacterium]MBK8382060.1 hypothetical protein [Ignavibacteria bacterium]MBK9406401.1 hypothetical protein [Ignavibacteria bacterium]
MSIVKEIYDVTKDLAGNKIALNKIKKALLTESKLNHKFLEELSETEKRISKERLIQIVTNLEVAELKSGITCGLPLELISSKKVDKEMLSDLDSLRALDNDLETVMEKVYLKIAYLKKDFNSENINLYIRVRNIYSYNQLLQRMLTK